MISLHHGLTKSLKSCLKGLVLKVVKIIGLIFLVMSILLLTAWIVLALAVQGSDNEVNRYLVITLFSFISLSVLMSFKYKHLRIATFSIYGIALLVFFAWYNTISPSNDRQWQEDVALLPYATQSENFIKVHNIRNFTYKTETDYTPAYYDKTFDLEKLKGVDIITVYWMGPAIAHVFLSFSFVDGEHLAISIETRKEKGEKYSTLKGFFRKYELYYVVADEKDVIKLRTNFRHNPPEDVYIYPTSGSIEEARQLFLAYVEKINTLRDTPEFYNTLTTNCTTNIWKSAHTTLAYLPFSWKILASGYVPEYLYQQDRLKTGGLSFLELEKRAHVNESAHKADNTEDFSSQIRN